MLDWRLVHVRLHVWNKRVEVLDLGLIEGIPLLSVVEECGCIGSWVSHGRMVAISAVAGTESTIIGVDGPRVVDFDIVL